jgi:hypothetical protein
MRGEPLHLRSIIGEADLRCALTEQLSNHWNRQISIVKLERRISEYCSSFIIEELDVVLEDGSQLALVVKDLSRSAMIAVAGRIKTSVFYDPVREIETYRRLLTLHDYGTPTYYGAVVAPDLGRYWLFLERVAPVLLWQMGDLDVWKEVARWLARMHTSLAPTLQSSLSLKTDHLLKYDREFYWRWMRRAVDYVCDGDDTRDQAHAAEILSLKASYGEMVERLVALPTTIIHGEFYPSNVLIDQSGERLRICPVDWEMTAIGPGLIDLAELTSGGWTAEQKEEMARAYYEALPPTAASDWGSFVAALELCRLHQAIQLLGWSSAWSPPPEHAQNWLGEAMRCAAALR